MSIFDTTISYFTKVNNTKKPIPVKLSKWLNPDKIGSYKRHVEQTRSIKEKPERDDYKKTHLPVATISGTFSYRSKEGFLEHSGFVCIDIDGKDNPHIGDIHALKDCIKQIPFVAYCGLSVSGSGIFCIFRIPRCTPDKHELYYFGLMEAFGKLGINCDDTPALSKVSASRFISYDPDGYFNESAPIFTTMGNLPIIDKQVKEPTTPRSHYTNTDSLPINADGTLHIFEVCLRKIESQDLDITQNLNTWFALGYSIASEYGVQGFDYFHRLSRFYKKGKNKYRESETDNVYRSCLRGVTSSNTIGYFFEICKQYQITYSDEMQLHKSKLHEQHLINEGLEPLQAEYPIDWDQVPPPQTGTAEYFEMIRYEIADSDQPRPELLGELDAKVDLITQLFDAVPINT